jgi:hypothetical protein
MGTSFISRRSWKRRWFVVDGQYMTYYEGFDQKAGKPYNKKGVIPLKGVRHLAVAHTKRKFCWVIRHEDRRPVYMSAENENEKYVWLESIEKASKMKDGEIKGKVRGGGGGRGERIRSTQ